MPTSFINSLGLLKKMKKKKKKKKKKKNKRKKKNNFVWAAKMLFLISGASQAHFCSFYDFY